MATADGQPYREPATRSRVRWEYYTVLTAPSRLTTVMNQLGQNGWELVTAVDPGGDGYRLFFKREA